MILFPSASVELRLANEWRCCGNSLFRGHFFIDGVLDDMDLIGSSGSAEEMLSTLAKAHGFFSFIISDEDTLILAVDHVRSIPIYYRMAEGRLIVSDDPALIVDLRQDKLGTDAVLDFLCVGYVTENGTLLQGVKQVEPGSCMVFRSGNLEKRTHFSYRPNIERSIVPDSYYDAFVEALAGSFRRLKEVTKGGQIALPLSGGCDSRLIATCLRRFGLDNVIAFAYGRAGDPDPATSKKVAEALGIEWFCVDYSNEKWEEISRTKSWSDYCAYAFQFSSVPHPQDYPAIEALVADGVLEKGATIIPGHRPDGAKVPEFALDGNGMVAKEAIAKKILDTNYRLFKIRPGSALDRRFQSRLCNSFDVDGAVPLNVAASVKERWFLRERAPKFIVHSVRCYEHFGLNWWLPLLDKGFLSFWARTAWSCKEKECYVSSGRRLMKEIVGEGGAVEGISWKIGGEQRALARYSLAPAALLGRFVNLDGLRNNRFFNDLLYQLGNFRKGDYESGRSLFGLVERGEFMRVYTGIETKNSFIALDLVKDLLDPNLMSPQERECFRSIVLFKSDMLRYLEGNRRRLLRGGSRAITRRTLPGSPKRGSEL